MSSSSIFSLVTFNFDLTLQRRVRDSCKVCSVYSLARVGVVKVRVDDRESRGVGHGPSRRACGRNREN